jgi:hypothetical protein
MQTCQYHGAFQVIFHDYYVLGNVYQTTRQVTGVGRFQGRIGQTLTGTVGRDEVLQYGKTIYKVGEDRVFNYRRAGSLPDFFGLAISPRRPHSCLICCLEPRAPEWSIMYTELNPCLCSANSS